MQLAVRTWLVSCGALLVLSSGACDGGSDGNADEVCLEENHCTRDRDGQLVCEDGFTWEDPDDSENYTCVPAEGGDGDGDGDGGDGDGDGDGGDGDGDGDGDGGDGDGDGDGGDGDGDGDGGDGDGDGDGGDGDGDGDGDPGMCDGACDALQYNACTCGSDDPCGWSGDGYCDASCADVVSDPFDDEADCGSTGQCPPNSHPVGEGQCACDEGFSPNADGTACVAAEGVCDGACSAFQYNACTCGSDDPCGWSNDGYCDDACTDIVDTTFDDGTDCPLTCQNDTECPDDLVCGAGGTCTIDVGTVPAGSPPDCSDVADWYCTGGEGTCGEIVAFDPDIGPGYWDYPLNGETSNNQYRSFARVDTMMLVKYAAAMVACKAPAWAGNGGLLGLGDMSEANGDIPGTSVGSPGHPAGTHVNGHDMDIGYYQVGTPDNKLRAICDHVVGGQDQYHCVNPPDKLDVWRTALFLAHMHDSHQLRVIGVDGQAGLMVTSAIQQLCSAGWYSGPACNNLKLAYEVTDGGSGWYLFHHHHFHISLNSWSPKPAGFSLPGVFGGEGPYPACLTADCSAVPALSAKDLARHPVDGVALEVVPRQLVIPLREKSFDPAAMSVE